MMHSAAAYAHGARAYACMLARRRLVPLRSAARELDRNILGSSTGRQCAAACHNALTASICVQEFQTMQLDLVMYDKI